MMQMIMNAIFQGFLSSIGLPQIIALAAAGMVAWRLMKDAKKPVLLLVLLAVGGVAVALMWPFGKSTGSHGGVNWAGLFPPPAVKTTEEPKPETKHLGPANKRRLAIRKLEASRWAKLARIEAEEKAKREPKAPKKVEEISVYLNQERREKEHQARMAKEIARRGTRYLVTAEDRERETLAMGEEARRIASIQPAPPPPRPMTPALARALDFQMREQWIARAQGDLQALRQKSQPVREQPTVYAGAGQERRYR